MKTPDFMVRTVLNGLLDPSAKSNPPAPPTQMTPGREKGRDQDQD
jgi:hypothetical protein